MDQHLVPVAALRYHICMDMSTLEILIAVIAAGVFCGWMIYGEDFTL